MLHHTLKTRLASRASTNHETNAPFTSQTSATLVLGRRPDQLRLALEGGRGRLGGEPVLGQRVLRVPRGAWQNGNVHGKRKERKVAAVVGVVPVPQPAQTPAGVHLKQRADALPLGGVARRRVGASPPNINVGACALLLGAGIRRLLALGGAPDAANPQRAFGSEGLPLAGRAAAVARRVRSLDWPDVQPGDFVGSAVFLVGGEGVDLPPDVGCRGRWPWP
mmetsp:Transcript_45752/g.114677  ORF Transcript_45752/g.114677 Transcript_45752/m.114677 type:complete len:221 (+) Transcript_45752:90-752(+)